MVDMSSPGDTGVHEVAGTAGASPALEVRGLARSFGMLKAVDAVSFVVPAGCIAALIGPNGAGKSTVFNLIAGVLAPDAGEVRFFGRPLDGMPAHQRARLGLGRTFQAPFPFPNMSVLENVMVGIRPASPATLVQQALATRRARHEEAQLRAKAVECVRTVGLAAVQDADAASLPAGQQRLLAIARSIAMDPRLLLLDEPAAGLNDSEKLELARLVRLLRDSGITVLVIEHAMDFVMNLADRIVVLDYGRKLAEGPPEEIAANSDVVAAYLGVD